VQNHFASSEIGQLRHSRVRDQDVGAFDVTMHHVSGVNVRDTHQNLTRK
jgi:hypothetical protein